MKQRFGPITPQFERQVEHELLPFVGYCRDHIARTMSQQFDFMCELYHKGYSAAVVARKIDAAHVAWLKATYFPDLEGRN